MTFNLWKVETLNPELALSNLVLRKQVANVTFPRFLLKRIEEITTGSDATHNLHVLYAPRLCDEYMIHKRKNLPKDNCL